MFYRQTKNKNIKKNRFATNLARVINFPGKHLAAITLQKPHHEKGLKEAIVERKDNGFGITKITSPKEWHTAEETESEEGVEQQAKRGDESEEEEWQISATNQGEIGTRAERKLKIYNEVTAYFNLNEYPATELSRQTWERTIIEIVRSNVRRGTATRRANRIAAHATSFEGDTIAKRIYQNAIELFFAQRTRNPIKATTYEATESDLTNENRRVCYRNNKASPQGTGKNSSTSNKPEAPSNEEERAISNWEEKEKTRYIREDVLNQLIILKTYIINGSPSTTVNLWESSMMYLFAHAWWFHHMGNENFLNTIEYLVVFTNESPYMPQQISKQYWRAAELIYRFWRQQKITDYEITRTLMRRHNSSYSNKEEKANPGGETTNLIHKVILSVEQKTNIKNVVQWEFPTTYLTHPWWVDRRAPENPGNNGGDEDETLQE